MAIDDVVSTPVQRCASTRGTRAESGLHSPLSLARVQTSDETGINATGTLTTRVVHGQIYEIVGGTWTCVRTCLGPRFASLVSSRLVAIYAFMCSKHKYEQLRFLT